MKRTTLLPPLLLGAAILLGSCGKDEPTGPDTSTPSVAQYAGVWAGTTGQSLPVYFRINSAGEIDSLTIRIRMSLPTFTCTATFVKDSSVTVRGNSFVARVMFAGASFVTRVRVTLSSESSSQGSYDGYGGSFSLICGSSWSMGTAGSIISPGTWVATKTGQ
jgi:hypothetical protein